MHPHEFEVNPMNFLHNSMATIQIHLIKKYSFSIILKRQEWCRLKYTPKKERLWQNYFLAIKAKGFKKLNGNLANWKVDYIFIAFPMNDHNMTGEMIYVK